MIPLKLQVKNFVSYGPKFQTIDFEPYNLICLSGKNGHGKSALLDAITWTLWGQARKISGISKADEGLLRLGQANMIVCLDFLSNGTHYRIKREYSNIGNKSYSHLEFGFIEKENSEKFKPLTDKTIRTTQEKIQKVIGIDYETFINSAFLRQGQSNEFSKKTPKERKEILASILGIDKFEKLRKYASEKLKEIENQRILIESTLNQFIKEDNKKSNINDELYTVLEMLKNLSSKENNLKEITENLNKEKNKIFEVKSKVQNLTFEKSKIEEDINYFANLFKEEVTTFRNIIKKQNNLDQFDNFNELYQNTRNKLKELQEISKKKVKLKESHLNKKEELNIYTEKVLNEIRQKIQNSNELLQKNVYQLKVEEEKLNECKNNVNSIENEIAQIDKENQINSKEIKQTDILQITLVSEETKYDKKNAYYHKYLTQNKTILKEIEELQYKNNLIQKNQAQCPLCQQELPNFHKSSLEKKLEKRENWLLHRHNRINKLINNLEQSLKDQNSNISNIKNEINLLSAKKVKLDETQNKLNELQNQKQKLILLKEESQKKITNLKEQINIIEKELYAQENKQKNFLINDEFYKKTQEELLKYENELNSISYNQIEEEELSKKLNELEKYKDEKNSLLKEIALQEQRKTQIHELNKKIKELKKDKINKTDNINKYKYIEFEEKQILEKEKGIQNRLSILMKEKENLILKKGGLEHQLKLLREQENKINSYKKKLKELEQSIEEYKAIIHALSKDGIQALLIEEALPEIEEEANNLLARLTDNQAHLIIESLKDLKSGGSKETLEIKVSDSMGIRPYELFSGGEAFRIDFALRIAISKLLARRAGTSLQTLIIDEGFGSQDEEGLSHIMEAIYKIQRDFSKIIIVSHLQSMKDQFPVNFFINKGPEGSILRIMTQG